MKKRGFEVAKAAPLLALTLTLALPMASRAATLKVGDRAPDFTLPNQNGQSVKLSSFLGKKTVVLAFYVLAFTGG